MFVTLKDYYGLRKKVNGENCEKLMVHFAVMAANASQIAKKRHEKPIA